MKRFVYHEQDKNGNDVCVTMNEKYILYDYYDYWCKKTRDGTIKSMFDRLSNECKESMCIDDFVSLHWAREI